MRYRQTSQTAFGYERSDQRLRAGLVAHIWPNESGFTIPNYATNINPATVVGSTARDLLANGFPAVQFIVAGDYLTFPPLTLTGSDFTFCLRLNMSASVGSNPGFFRVDAASDGTTFVIIQGAAQTLPGGPWMRVAGIDVIKPTTGYVIPLGEELVLAFRYIDSGGTGAFFANGVKQHENAVGSLANAGFSIYNYGYQTDTSQSVFGKHGDLRFYNRALSDAEIVLLADPSFIPFVFTQRRSTNEQLTGWAPLLGGRRNVLIGGNVAF